MDNWVIRANVALVEYMDANDVPIAKILKEIDFEIALPFLRGELLFFVTPEEVKRVERSVNVRKLIALWLVKAKYIENKATSNPLGDAPSGAL